MKDLLRTLVETPGPPGHEEPVRRVILEILGKRAVEARVDGLGNLIVRVRAGREGGSRLMIAVPMDEIGMMVSHVQKDGFARFASLGQPDLEAQVGRRVRFLDGPTAILGAEPGKDSDTRASAGRFFLDFGREEGADPPVEVGDVAVFDTVCDTIGDRMIGKAMKNRAAVAVVLEALEQLGDSPHELCIAFTAQGQVGSRGAPAATYALRPDAALAIGVTPADDTPGASGAGISVGGGPVLPIREARAAADRELVAWIARLAKDCELPCQRAVIGGRATDLPAIQGARAGTAAAGLRIPLRYPGTSYEMIDTGDLERTAALLRTTLEQPLPQ